MSRLKNKHKHLLVDADFVQCPICEKKLKYIQPAHCRMHELSFDEFREMYPDIPTMTKTESDKRSANRKAAQSKINTTYEQKGSKVGFANPDLANKSRDTMEEKYGTRNIMQAEGFAKNRPNPMKDPEVSKRAGQTLSNTIAKRGGHWNKGKTYEEIMGEEKAKELKEYKSELAIDKFDLNEILPYFNLELDDEAYRGARYRHKWKCNVCNETFEQEWNKIQQNLYPCPTCVPRTSGESKAENEIYEFIMSLNLPYSIERHNKSLLDGKELDIYIPEKQIAFEYNGLYWHNTERKHKNYHVEKTDQCESKGIQLIHIFEDEWVYRKKVVKSRLLYLLGLQSNIINARNCNVKVIDNETKDEFLLTNHIQGRDIGASVRLGAYHYDELVAVMTFGPLSVAKGEVSEDGSWELKRFATKTNLVVNGVAGKLLSHFKKKYPWKKIITFADRRWSQGNLYRVLGFEEIRKTEPGYWYIKGLKRYHRYKLRKRFDEPKGIPERILRESEGYKQIYDCGHIRFEMVNL